MKKILFALSALIVLVGIIFLAPANSAKANSDFLRIHIRADSNSQADQDVKYVVKSAVVDYLTPYLAEATTKDKAMSIVKSHLSGIERGSGSGNNWWCVVYPPLCFVGGESNGTNQIVYKSKLAEIIRNWQENH